MRLSRSRKAVSSPNTAPKPRRRLFKTAKDSDSYLFKAAKAQREGEKMPPDMITQLKFAIDKLSKDHNDNKDKILTSLTENTNAITENTNETKVIKSLLTALRTKMEGMEVKISDLERDLDYERNKRMDIENELEDMRKREHWDRASRTMVVTGLDKEFNINADMTKFEIRKELQKHFETMRDELQSATVFKGAKGLVAIVTARTLEGRIEIQREIKDVCKNRMGKTNNYEIYISDYYLKDDLPLARDLLEYGKIRKNKQEIGGYAVRYNDKGIVYLERAQNQSIHKVVPSSVVKNDPDYEKARGINQDRQRSPARSNSQQMKDRQADRINKARQNESRAQHSNKRSAGKSPQDGARETGRPRMEYNYGEEEMAGN